MAIISRITKYIKYYIANYILDSLFVYSTIKQPLFKITEFGIIVACFSGIADQLLGEYTYGVFSEIERWSIRCVIAIVAIGILITFCIQWFAGMNH